MLTVVKMPNKGLYRNGNLYRFYNCGTYKAYGKHGSCTSHHIRYEILYTYVLSRIQHWAWQAMLGEDQLLDTSPECLF